MKSDSNLSSESSVKFALEIFSHQLIQDRKSYRMSQRQLATLTGTTQASISAIERGSANPTIGLLSDLTAAFDGELRIRIVHRPASRRKRK